MKPEALFKDVPLFAGLNDEALAMLANVSQAEAYEEGEIIVAEGTPGDAFFVIESGSVDVVKFAGEGETWLATLGAKQFFGEMSLLDARPRSASIRATEPTCVHAIRGGALQRLFVRLPEQHSLLLLHIARDLVSRLRALDEKFAALA